ncbi:hypothetical protein D3C87_1727040 [compost metagenome]
MGKTLPYRPNTSMASGFMASSMRSASTYGQSRTPARTPGMFSRCTAVTNSTYLALPVGSTCLSSSDTEYPTHGITMDQPSTQRRR